MLAIFILVINLPPSKYPQTKNIDLIGAIQNSNSVRYIIKKISKSAFNEFKTIF